MTTSPPARSMALEVSSAEARVAAYDWLALQHELDGYGCAVLSKLLSSEECRTIADLYTDERHFRSHIVMARHGFGKGDTATSNIRCPTSSAIFEPRSIRASQSWPTNGARGWESMSDIPTTTRRSSHDATPPARRGQRRFCSSTSRVTSTASTRISMAISHSRSRLRFSSQSPARISQAASLSSPNSGRACRAALRSYRFGRVMPWPSPFITGRYRARRATIA